MEQIASALSEASLRKGETERLKEDLAVNEKATQGRKGDIEQVGPEAMIGMPVSTHFLAEISECHGSFVSLEGVQGSEAPLLRHHKTEHLRSAEVGWEFLRGALELVFGCFPGIPRTKILKKANNGRQDSKPLA